MIHDPLLLQLENCLHVGETYSQSPRKVWKKTPKPDWLRRRCCGCKAGKTWREKRRKFKQIPPLIIVGSVRLLADKMDLES